MQFKELYELAHEYRERGYGGIAEYLNAMECLDESVSSLSLLTIIDEALSIELPAFTTVQSFFSIFLDTLDEGGNMRVMSARVLDEICTGALEDRNRKPAYSVH